MHKNTPPGRRHWLLYEASLSGHHEVYLTEIVRALRQADAGRITVVLSLARHEHPDADLDASSLLPGLAALENVTVKIRRHADAFEAGAGALGLFKREWHYWCDLRAAVREENPAAPVTDIFLPYLDYCLYMLALLGVPSPHAVLHGVAMRPSFHHREVGVDSPVGAMDRIKGVLFKRFLRRRQVATVFAIDPTLPAYMESQPASTRRKVVALHDPAEFHGSLTRAEARVRLNIPQTARVVLAYGAIDDRKGLGPLLQALASLPKTSDIVLVVAGKCTPSILALLRTPEAQALHASQRLQVLDRRIPDEEEQMLFACCDAVWLGYQGHYSMSGVLMKALVGGRGILATSQGLIGWYARRQGGSAVFDTSNPAEVGAVLADIRPAGNELTSEFAETFSWRAAARTLRAGLGLARTGAAL